MRKLEYIKSPMVYIHSTNDKSNSSTNSKSSLCGDCWGSGWAVQFVQPCTKCKSSGKS